MPSRRPNHPLCSIVTVETVAAGFSLRRRNPVAATLRQSTPPWQPAGELHLLPRRLDEPALLQEVRLVAPLMSVLVNSAWLGRNCIVAAWATVKLTLVVERNNLKSYYINTLSH